MKQLIKLCIVNKSDKHGNFSLKDFIHFCFHCLGYSNGIKCEYSLRSSISEFYQICNHEIAFNRSVSIGYNQKILN